MPVNRPSATLTCLGLLALSPSLGGPGGCEAPTPTPAPVDTPAPSTPYPPLICEGSGTDTRVTLPILQAPQPDGARALLAMTVGWGAPTPALDTQWVGADGTQGGQTLMDLGADRSVKAALTPEEGGILLLSQVAAPSESYLLRVGSQGQLLGEEGPWPGSLTGIVHSGDGYLLTGSTSNTAAPQPLILLVDEAGVLQRRVEHSRPYPTQVLGAAAAPGGGALLVGQSGDDGWVGRIDADGALLWDRIPEAYERGRFTHAAVTGDGLLVAAGENEIPGSADQGAWVMAFDQDAEVAWERTLHRTAPDGYSTSSRIGGVAPLGERGLVVAAYDYEFEEYGQSALFRLGAGGAVQGVTPIDFDAPSDLGDAHSPGEVTASSLGPDGALLLAGAVYVDELVYPGPEEDGRWVPAWLRCAP